MKGIITRLYLENFVTYKRVEFWPGRNLNVIIGPNGTGKSTIVCAIVLGLGGKPKVVARGSNVGAYVREGCQSARIEIELLNPDGKNFIITRVIDLNNKSVWSYNGAVTSQKEIEKIIAGLHIQVDNLCQFLPQDRVQDFAKMDQKSLLENTEKTVGKAGMFDLHTELKRLRDAQLALEQEINTTKTRAAEEQQQNDRFEVQVTNLAEKKLLTDRIFSLKQKLAWKKHFAVKPIIQKLERDQKEAQKNKDDAEKAKLRLEKKKKECKDNYNKAEGGMKKMTNEGSKQLNSLNEKLRDAARIEEKIDELADQLQRDITEEEKRGGEIEKITQMVNKLQNDAQEAEREPEHDIKTEMAALHPQIRQYTETIHQSKSQVESLNRDIESIRHNRNAKNAEITNLENMRNQRLKTLQARCPGIYRGIMWLRENEHEFRGKVYGPMMLEINVNDNKYAKYVEACISGNDLMAFSCQFPDDMTKLLKKLRGEMKLEGINCITLNDDHTEYMPRYPIEKLSKFGFQTYARETFTAPPLIMQYLCRAFQVHEKPIGNNTTFNKSDQVPDHISFFFSDNNVFIIRTSKYSHEKNAKTSFIKPAVWLSSSVDAGQIQDIQDSLNELEIQEQQLNAGIVQIREQAQNNERKLDTLRSRKKLLQEKLDNKRTVQARLNAKIQQRIQLEENRRDVQQLKDKCNVESQNYVKKLCMLQQDIILFAKQLYDSMLESSLAKEERDKLRDLLQYAENEYAESNTKIRDAQDRINTINRQLEGEKRESKQLRAAAKELTEGLSPNDSEFMKFKSAFALLPEILEEIEDEIMRKQGQVDCLGSDNDDLLADYEARKETIAQMNKEVAQGEGNAAALQKKIDEAKEKWLPPLQDLISRINTNFGNSFNQLGCAGEVSLSTGANINDFHQYGLCIKVKYRDSEQLQELNQHLQSGGERAVATAIFMISLQELTHVPFRCVDEINQGMDPINERLIFELLVKTTSQSDTAQYFLLTPKLLPSLLYEKTVNVMCVFNGKKCAKNNWSVKNYCKLKGRLNRNAGNGDENMMED